MNTDIDLIHLNTTAKFYLMDEPLGTLDANRRQEMAEYIKQQFMELIRHAKIYNSVIAIAHPHPETIKVLTELIPLLAKENINLVPISQLLPPIENLDDVTTITD